MRQVWNPPPSPEGWRPVRFADLAAIMNLLPPPPLTQDGLTHRFEGPKPHDTIYAIRAAFMEMLDATPPSYSGAVLHKLDQIIAHAEGNAKAAPASRDAETWGNHARYCRELREALDK